MLPALKSDRITLLPLTPAHKQPYMALINDPTIGPRLNQPLPFEETHFHALLTQREKQKHFFVWMIEHEGTIVGAINAAAGVHEKRFQGGYWLTPAARGKGLTSEALGLVRDYLFETHAAERLQAQVEPDNIASMRVLEKAGYQREGLLRKFYPDRERGLVDVYMYALVR